MNDFKEWFNNNKEKLNLVSRNELAELAYQAGIDNDKPLLKLKFGNREIIEYELKTELTLENQNGFNLESFPRKKIMCDFLQTQLNKDGGINIIDWLHLSQESPCIIEFSKGDIIDYSDLVDKDKNPEEEGASCECGRSFLAFIKQSLKFIEIIEVIEKCN